MFDDLVHLIIQGIFFCRVSFDEIVIFFALEVDLLSNLLEIVERDFLDSDVYYQAKDAERDSYPLHPVRKFRSTDKMPS